MASYLFSIWILNLTFQVTNFPKAVMKTKIKPNTMSFVAVGYALYRCCYCFFFPALDSILKMPSVKLTSAEGINQVFFFISSFDVKTSHFFKRVNLEVFTQINRPSFFFTFIFPWYLSNELEWKRWTLQFWYLFSVIILFWYHNLNSVRILDFSIALP